MKKLLSILGTVSLTATGASSVVACKITTKENEKFEETDLSKDLRILSTISEKINKEFKKSLFKENILLTDNNLSKAYDWVNANKPSLILRFDNTEHQNFKKYLLKYFYEIFNDINQQIKDEYSNYYQNNESMFVLASDIDITLNFVNLEELSRLLNINITDNLKVVRIQFDFKYKVKFKNYERDSDFTVLFNLTNNLKEFNLINDGSLTFFKKELNNFFRDKNMIDITTISDFKKLYDNLDIDYKKSITSIDNIYKEILNVFIMDNQKLKEIITYNKSKNFLEKQTTLFNDDNDKGFYYNDRNSIAKNSFLTRWYNKNNEVKVNDFVDLYMEKIVSKFNTNSNIELGQFKINLNYINFYGIVLNGYFNINDNDFISTIILPKNKLKEKITNFGNLIIAFLKYYKVEYKDKYYFNVPNNLWNKLNEKITNFKMPEILFKEFSIDQNIINQNLADLNLFNFKQISGWHYSRIKFDIEKNMFFYSSGGNDAGFTFGTSQFIYMPFYYLWNNYNYVVVKA